MGSFSWYASDTHRAIRSANPFPVYALQPDGEPLLEKRYENNGVFCGKDIYELVADWNRKFLAEHPSFLVFQYGRVRSKDNGAYFPAPPKRVDSFPWYPLYADLTKSRKDIEHELYEGGEVFWQYRHIGIEIACGDDRNTALPFPIKLVEVSVPYAEAAASKIDPEQGFGRKDRFEGEKFPDVLAED